MYKKNLAENLDKRLKLVSKAIFHHSGSVNILILTTPAIILA